MLTNDFIALKSSQAIRRVNGKLKISFSHIFSASIIRGDPDDGYQGHI
jgi:hypothetical protein